MPLPARREYTTEDIFSLPDGQRAELIDGKMYMMAPPSTRHQRILGDLYAAIRKHIQENMGDCEVIMAPFAVFLGNAEENEDYVEPDISVICDKSKIDEDGCHGAPDWVIEIVSPSSRRMDYSRKQALYAESGVREYWIVDPMRETVVIYRMADDWTPVFYKFGDNLPVGIYDGKLILTI